MNQTPLLPVRVEWNEQRDINDEPSRRASMYLMPNTRKWCWSTGFDNKNEGFGYAKSYAEAEKHCLKFMEGRVTP
jgi:hypothetical protein